MQIKAPTNIVFPLGHSTEYKEHVNQFLANFQTRTNFLKIMKQLWALMYKNLN